MNSGLQEAIRPFRPRPVRMLLLGDLFFYLSFWVIQINLSWVLYQITKSSFHLGLLGFLVNIPMIVVLPFAGILADRFNRRRIILWSQVAWIIPTIVLIFFSIYSTMSLALIMIVGIIYGCVFALVKPAADALTRDVVAEKDDIHRVTGIDGAMNKVMQFIGGAVDAILQIAWANVAPFLGSFFLTIFAFICFFRIKPPHKFIPEVNKKPVRQLAEGFGYVFHRLCIWSTTILAAVSLGIVIALLFQLPIFAGTVLKGNISYLHYFYYAAGIGGTTGGVILGLQIHNKGLLKLTRWAMILLGIALIVFGFSRNIVLSTFAMLVSDGSTIFIFASAAASIQFWIDDSKRGRVMSIYSMFCIGTIPFANLIMGAFGGFVGIPITVIGAGVLCIIVAIAYWIIQPLNNRSIAIMLEELKATE